MMKSIYLLSFIALLSGVVLPIQAVLNAKLGKTVGDPIYGALISFIIGGLGLLLYCLIVRTDFSQITQATSSNWLIWTGGLMGAFYVVAVIILVPKMGTALTFGLVIAGQMGFSLVMDHYGWFAAPIQAISWQKILGVLLIIGGAILLRDI